MGWGNRSKASAARDGCNYMTETCREIATILTDWLANSPFLQIQVQQDSILDQLLSQCVGLRRCLRHRGLYVDKCIQLLSLGRCRRSTRHSHRGCVIQGFWGIALPHSLGGWEWLVGRFCVLVPGSWEMHNGSCGLLIARAVCLHCNSISISSCMYIRDE